VRPEGVSQRNTPITPSRIEPRLLSTIQTYLGVHGNCPGIFVHFNKIWSFSTDFWWSHQYQILPKSVQWDPRWSTRTDGRTAVTRLLGTFGYLRKKRPKKKRRNYARQVPGQFRLLTSPSSLQILISVTQLRIGNNRNRTKTLWLPISAVRVTFVAGRRDSITWPKHAQNLPDITYPTTRLLRHPHRTSQVHNDSKGPVPVDSLNTNYEPPLEIRHNTSLCRKFDTRCCWSNEKIL